MHTRRNVLFALAALPFAKAAYAQSPGNYLSGPLRIIIPFPAGGPTDIVGRIIANKLGPRIGQPVIIENKGGAAGSIGMHAAAMAKPDGHTIVLVAPTAATNPSLYQLPFDTLRDLTALTQHVSLQYMLVVHRNLPANNVKELVQLAKSRASPLSYGTWGVGSHSHLCAVQLETVADIRMTHVPYRGSAPAMSDVIGGQVDFMFDSVASAIPQVQAGNVRALAVSSREPASGMTSVPPLAQTFPEYDITGWQGFMAPSKVPTAYLAFLQREIAAVLHDPEVTQRLQGMGLSIVASTPEAFDRFLRAEIDKYAALIRAANIKLD